MKIILIDESEPQSEFYQGESSMLLNGQPWNVQTAAIKHNGGGEKFYLGFGESDISGIVDSRELAFNFLERKTGTIDIPPYNPNNPLDEPSCYFTMLLYDGDVLGDTYLVFEKPTIRNSITVDSINEETNEIWGQFEVALARDTTLEKFDLSYPAITN